MSVPALSRETFYSGKILLADGDTSMRHLVGQYLSKLGFEVFLAHTGREALRIARQERPDLIVLEIKLPEIGGLEVCHQLKDDAATRDIVFLFLTATDDMDTKVRAFQVGADDFLAKPFSPRELEVRILSAFRRKRRLAEASASLKSIINSTEVERIVRSIEFPPEYHRSGITILSYFADVLRHKNLSDDVKVSIEQSGLKVSLVIDSPTGQRELIEQTLEAYGMVVLRRQPPEFLTTDPYEVAELKSQLRLAEVQIETQRELLAAKNADVESLRAEVKDTKSLLGHMQEQAGEDRARFMSLMEGLVSHNTTLATGLKDLATQAAKAQNRALASALKNLDKVIERGVREEDREEVMQNLTTIQREDPSVFQRVYDTLLMGAISEGAGNYLYAWLQFFVGTLPK